jgi:hypothetical protein
MQTANRAGPQSSAWFVEPDRVRAKPQLRKGLRRGADTETSVRAIIASSLFLVLLAAGMLFGGHAAIAPILRFAIDARNSAGKGDVLLTMPDGKYCRHMSFDNATNDMIEGDIERCPEDISDDRGHSVQGFAWGTH